MQDQKITPSFLIFSTDYTYVEVGLYRGPTQLAYHKEHKFTASKYLMARVLELLKQSGISWNNLDFLAANQGPGPFTTLRVIISTLNGLHFATQLPLVGIDGLETLYHEHARPQGPTIALLNAFNNDVYYAYAAQEKFYSGWSSLAELIDSLKSSFLNTDIISFIGNGTLLHQDTLKSSYPQACFNIAIQTASLQSCAHQALVQWCAGKAQQTPLLPLYLKTIEYKKST